MPRANRIQRSGLKRENDPSLLILMSLATGPKHGLALMDDIEQFAAVRLGPGTLYGAITRLESQGLIEALERDGTRRPYRITESGAASLSTIMAELEKMVEIGRERLISLRPSFRTV